MVDEGANNALNPRRRTRQRLELRGLLGELSGELRRAEEAYATRHHRHRRVPGGKPGAHGQRWRNAMRAR